MNSLLKSSLSLTHPPSPTSSLPGHLPLTDTCHYTVDFSDKNICHYWASDGISDAFRSAQTQLGGAPGTSTVHVFRGCWIQSQHGGLLSRSSHLLSCLMSQCPPTGVLALIEISFCPFPFICVFLFQSTAINMNIRQAGAIYWQASACAIIHNAGQWPEFRD